jgi:predicted nucleic acid-binding protein
MPFVLDASVAVAWAFDDEISPYPNRVLELLATDIARVPSIWPLETANALLSAERRQRIHIAETSRFVSLLQSLPIELGDLPPQRALGAVLELGRSHALSAYDAAYLELAMREGLPLATQDDRLRSTAQRLLVPLVQ